MKGVKKDKTIIGVYVYVCIRLLWHLIHYTLLEENDMPY